MGEIEVGGVEEGGVEGGQDSMVGGVEVVEVECVRDSFEFTDRSEL